MTKCVVVTTTLPGEAEAGRIAEAAVGERLAACAQVQGPLKSTFHWRGGVDHADEWYCHLKTTRKRLPALEALIRALHPYAVPEIIAIDIVAGHAPYLSWIEQTVRGEKKE
jgi:periplasmic divalent cation tolerance protein